MRNGTRKALAALLFGVVGVLGAAGCTQSGGTTPDPALPRPFAKALFYDQQERQVLHTADERLVADCMRRRGLHYDPQPLATGGTDPQDVNPYGLLTVTQARQDGYGITSARLAARPLDTNGDHAREPRWSHALLGTKSHEVRLHLPGGVEFLYNSDACVTQARQTLYGADYDRLSSRYQVLSNQVVTAVLKDPRYLRAQHRWAVCMRAAGLAVTTSDDPRGLVEQRLERATGARPAQPHDVARYELKVAGQDADCQRTTDLPHTVTEAQSRAETAVAGAHPTDLSRLTELRSAAVERATAPSGG
ncbi:hypothetical protein OG241_21235 [Streptomyces sp. NBC_01390]|uniref:hypothetical protein n=1 Tax=Streptomyces sp. NBC_01390 TaxID=2903850 RepID=UPI0032434C87